MIEEIERKYQDEQLILQNSQQRKITLLMNANMKETSLIISNHSETKPNNNKVLKKQLTEQKRRLRKSLIELIVGNTEKARLLNDQKTEEIEEYTRSKYADN